MDPLAAARLGDEVAHGFGLMAMVGGAVLGAVVGAVVVGATVATGGAALAIVAGSVAAGGLGLGQLVKGICTAASLPEPTSGALVMGSANIRINRRAAMRASMDTAAVCSGLPMNHYPWPAPLIAEGSATVHFNGVPAARLSSKMACGAHIKSGSGNVRIGGPTQRTNFVWDAEQWTEWALIGLGIAALGYAGRAAWVAGRWLGVAKLGGMVGLGFGGFELLGQIGDRLGPGYRDILQGAAGVVLLGLSPKLAKGLKEPVGKTLAEPERGLGNNAGHSLAESVTPGGSGQALAGHGVMDGTAAMLGEGQFVSPAGTTVVTPRAGITIADSTGRILENVKSVEQLEQVLKTGIGPNGEILTPRNYADLKGYQVIEPGQTGYNYTLLNPSFQNKPLNIFENSTTTLEPAPLSSFLEPNQGCVFWAACTQPVPFIPRWRDE